LEIDDLANAVETAQAAGATVESQSFSEKWGSIAMCADPFGNGFCLIQPRY
jgi:predicted enzyme related to lactoylglutathione lyase